jgi:hypothetical protein
MSHDRARRVLHPAALWMQEKVGKDTVAREKMHAKMQSDLLKVAEEVTPETFCRNLIDRANILADYGEQAYIFRHKSFREYFAAMELVKVYKEKDRLRNLVRTFHDNWWPEVLRYFFNKADSNALNEFLAEFFNSGKSRELTQDEQSYLQLLIRERAETDTTTLFNVLNDSKKSVQQKRYALDCLKTIGGKNVAYKLKKYMETSTEQSDILEKADEIVQETAEISFAKLKVSQDPDLFKLWHDLPKSFRNNYEYNLEYIHVQQGSFPYSVTNKTENVADLYFAKYPVTNKRYRRFIRYLRGKETELKKQLPVELFRDKLVDLLTRDKEYAKQI